MLNLEELELDNLIGSFYAKKLKLDKYKKETDSENKRIKELMTKLDITEYKNTLGKVAKLNIQKRESFNEEKLLAKLKELNGLTAIKTIEVVDMDELENLIYNGDIDASQLSGCKKVQEIKVLKVTQAKENK